MRILVAMSGGVDSSVAAGILRDQGHDVVGATLKLWGGASDSGCCSVSDVDDARRVAQVLGIDHHVFNYTDEFDQFVVEPFVADHAAGLTPNPCIECNRHIKFDLLFERAERLGFDAVATGHHAQILEVEGRPFLSRGADPQKDQSYVLGYLTEPILRRLLLPIGHLTKEQVRQEAERLGLRTWNKPDSQDVCFIEASKGREAFLSSRLTLTPATVYDRVSGDVVGHAPAAELVTLGQRRGIAAGIDGERRYVTKVDIGQRRVEVDRLETIYVQSALLDATSLTYSYDPLVDGQQLCVQWSAHGRSLLATLSLKGECRLDFSEEIRPIAPGQSVVFYREDAPSVVLGAAVVTR